MSGEEPSLSALQISTDAGVKPSRGMQLTACAKRRAVEVLPVPRPPVNR